MAAIENLESEDSANVVSPLICSTSSELQFYHLCNGCDKDNLNCQCCLDGTLLIWPSTDSVTFVSQKIPAPLLKTPFPKSQGGRQVNGDNFIFMFIISLWFVSFQVDSGSTGRVLASDAAVFLKKSGLPDLILGKVVLFHCN